MKFCDREPVVDVSCEETADGWAIVVADNGIGVDPDDHRQIFGMFERCDRSHPGFGLGLASALRIAELHGGTIAVASQVGVGSTFTVTLTRRRS
jgi:signal transduction histidine kinase